MTRFLRVCVAAALFAVPCGWACGPFFPNSYLVFGDLNALNMPEMSFFHELLGVLGTPAGAEGSTEAELLQEVFSASPAAWVQSLDADVATLKEALTNAGSDSENTARILDDYSAMRRAMRDHGEENRSRRDQVEEYKIISKYGLGGEAPPEPTLFDWTPYDRVMNEIPKEFALYVRGAGAYYGFLSPAAIQEFQLVLDLPPDQRPYRSTWAAYMLGKCLVEIDPAGAAGDSPTHCTWPRAPTAGWPGPTPDGGTSWTPSTLTPPCLRVRGRKNARWATSRCDGCVTAPRRRTRTWRPLPGMR
jgi:hypothetical protein